MTIFDGLAAAAGQATPDSLPTIAANTLDAILGIATTGWTASGDRWVRTTATSPTIYGHQPATFFVEIDHELGETPVIYRRCGLDEHGFQLPGVPGRLGDGQESYLDVHGRLRDSLQPIGSLSVLWNTMQRSGSAPTPDSVQEVASNWMSEILGVSVAPEHWTSFAGGRRARTAWTGTTATIEVALTDIGDVPVLYVRSAGGNAYPVGSLPVLSQVLYSHNTLLTEAA